MGYYDGMGVAFALVGLSILFFAVIGLVFYVLKSIGLSTLAANRGIENPWLAWIPVADLYIMGLVFVPCQSWVHPAGDVHCLRFNS
jgi:hypothetical protein